MSVRTQLPDDHRYRSCIRKIAYETLVDAFDAAVDIYEKDHGILRPYRCRYAEHWHLATVNARRNRKRHGRRLEKAHRKRLTRKAERSAVNPSHAAGRTA